VHIFFMVACLLLERKFLGVEPLQLSLASAVLLNNLFGLVPLGAALAMYAEPARYARMTSTPQQGWLLLAISCVLAVAMAYSGTSLAKMITGTTRLVSTNMSKLIVIAYGMVVMHENHSPEVMVGLLVSLVGGGFYAYDRQQAGEIPAMGKPLQRLANAAT
jgi:drug/metabolite transporter (DMT)-like permease